MGTHLRVLGESYPMNTNTTGFKWFSKYFFGICALDEGSLSIERDNAIYIGVNSLPIQDWIRLVPHVVHQKKNIQ